MDALECISTRRSIRNFRDIPVDLETMMTVIEGGSLAPNAGNLQDWKFILVTDKGLKKKISEYSLGQPYINNAAFLVVICSDPGQLIRHYGLRGERLYTVQNCAAAAQNMLLTAHAIGLGGVWVGAFDEMKIKSLLDVRDHARPQIVLAFGYPSEIPPHKRLTDLKLVVRFNNYGGKLKDIHRILRDYSVDWEARINKAHDAIDKIKERGKSFAQKTGKEIKKKSAPTIKQKINEIKKKFKNRK